MKENNVCVAAISVLNAVSSCPAAGQRFYRVRQSEHFPFTYDIIIENLSFKVPNITFVVFRLAAVLFTTDQTWSILNQV